MIRSILVASFLAAVPVSEVRAQKLTDAEVAKLSRDAVGYVLVDKKNAGMACCVDESGIFVTAEEVVRGAENVPIRVVMRADINDPNIRRTQPQTLLRSESPARVIRVDKSLGLALLRTDPIPSLKSLGMAQPGDLTELIDVTTFESPVERLKVPIDGKFPAMNIKKAHVNSLFHKNDELNRVYLDARLDSGSLGGPVIDEKGHLIGIVASGQEKANEYSELIPLNHLARFLAKPAIEIKTQSLFAFGRPMSFYASVANLLPGLSQPSVRLILRVGNGSPHEYPMQRKSRDLYVAPVAVATILTPTPLQIDARFESGRISGLTNDADIKIGGVTAKLSQLQSFQATPTPYAQLAENKTAEGSLAGLEQVAVVLGNQTVVLDLNKALLIEVKRPSEDRKLLVTIVASVDGKEVERLESSITIEGPLPILTAPASPQARPSIPSPARRPLARPSTPPEKESPGPQPFTQADDVVIKELPESFSNVALGGGGRYLIFHLPRAKVLAVFDVREAKIIHYIPLDEDKVVFAAGLDKIVVGLMQRQVLQRWSLTTFVREAEVSTKEEIKRILMGFGSNGPVVVNSQFMDLNTLEPLSLRFEPSRGWPPDPGPNLLVSSDGTVYAGQAMSFQPGTCTTYILEGGKIGRYDSGSYGHVVPGPDGRLVFTAQGVVSSHLERVNSDDAKFGYCLPATSGPFFLKLIANNDLAPGIPSPSSTFNEMEVYLVGESRPIAKLKDFKYGMTFNKWDREDFGVWRRIFLVPEAKVVAMLPMSNDRVVLRKFDIDAALTQSGINYLFVTSHAPSEAKRGRKYQYAVVAKSKSGGVEFKLDSAPKGMTVSKEGVVEWPVPTDAQEGNQEVILTVRDPGGYEVFHTFTVRVTNRDSRPIAPAKLVEQPVAKGDAHPAPPAKPAATEKGPEPGEIREFEIAAGVKIKFCWVPPGEAQLGSPKEERDYIAAQFVDSHRSADMDGEVENRRGKYVSKGFWLGKYTVTQEEWQAVMGNNPSRYSVGGKGKDQVLDLDTSRFPVEEVPWEDATQFVDKLNKLGGADKVFNRRGKFVLPNEDEWEYACRGGQGNKRPFCFGNELNGTQANCNGNNPYGTETKGPFLQRTTAVGTYERVAPHPWGLCDMHGNVWQWCENWSDNQQNYRVIRGGSWHDSPDWCRAAMRGFGGHGYHTTCGFRACFRLD